ncbi:MAG: nucleotidyltransferase [Chloroflexi bacterium]|nr:nucleotidyltransferase [Chloroflexota bacterium]
MDRATKPRWRSVLRKVAAKLNEAGIDYKVVGGTVAALYGISTPVNDVDIEFGAEDVYRAEKVLAEFMTNPVQFKESEVYRSHIGHLEIDGQLVEIFGELERRQGDTWISSMAVTHNTIEIEGVSVQVPWLEEETLSYLRRGKLERAALCLSHCDPERMRALLTDDQPTNVI